MDKINTLPIEKRYRPSNGTDGMRFMSRFCEVCEHESVCEIHMESMSFDKDEDDYPMEWTYDSNENPTCTAFQSII